MKRLAALFFLLTPLGALAQTAASPQIMTDIHAGDFQSASQLASATGDPLVQKLVTYFRLISPGGASAAEIQRFIQNNPDWPMQGLLKLREIEASGIYQPPSPAFTPDLITQINALDAKGDDQTAARLWVKGSATALAQATGGQPYLFWPAANALARTLLLEGDAKDAYLVITSFTPPQDASEQNLDRDFLAGFVQLQYLKNPNAAAPWFLRLAASSPAVITQARAYYWLGRTATGAEAAQDYARAAAYPTTFYGQIAALTLGETPQQLAAQIKSIPAPHISVADALQFGLGELPRAAILLVQMNDPHDAKIFLKRLGQTALDDKSRYMAALLAARLGFTGTSASIAREAGIAGQMLVAQGWPIAYHPPAAILDPAIALGIIRQESNFDSNAISGAGAIGLMQLMPSTARYVSRKYDLPDDDLFNPQQNMQLGATYLARQIAHFGACVPLAIAAYNAGPGNVANWLAEYGQPGWQPKAGLPNIIDWIEEIPFDQTRDYVERVSENITIYRALLTGAAVSPVTNCGASS